MIQIQDRKRTRGEWSMSASALLLMGAVLLYGCRGGASHRVSEPRERQSRAEREVPAPGRTASPTARHPKAGSRAVTRASRPGARATAAQGTRLHPPRASAVPIRPSRWDPWKGAGWWPEASWARRPKVVWKKRAVVLLDAKDGQGLFCSPNQGLWFADLKRPRRKNWLLRLRRRPPRAFSWLLAGLLDGLVLKAGQGRCTVPSNPSGPRERARVWGEMQHSMGLVGAWKAAPGAGQASGGKAAWSRMWKTDQSEKCLGGVVSAGPGRLALSLHHSHDEWSLLQMVAADTGKVLWEFKTKSRLSRPWSDGRTVVVEDLDAEKLLALDFDTGKQVWTSDWKGLEPSGLCPMSRAFLQDPTNGLRVNLATGKATPTMACRDGHKVVWRLQDLPHVCGGGRVFGAVQETGSTDSEFGALDLRYGQVLWHKKLCGGQSVERMALSKDALLVVCRAPRRAPFRLLALDPSDGRELWALNLDRYRGSLSPAEDCRSLQGPSGMAVEGSRLYVTGAVFGYLLDFASPAGAARKAEGAAPR